MDKLKKMAIVKEIIAILAKEGATVLEAEAILRSASFETRGSLVSVADYQDSSSSSSS